MPSYDRHRHIDEKKKKKKNTPTPKSTANTPQRDVIFLSTTISTPHHALNREDIVDFHNVIGDSNSKFFLFFEV
jgi:hypothetical protein